MQRVYGISVGKISCIVRGPVNWQLIVILVLDPKYWSLISYASLEAARFLFLYQLTLYPVETLNITLNRADTLLCLYPLILLLQLCINNVKTQWFDSRLSFTYSPSSCLSPFIFFSGVVSLSQALCSSDEYSNSLLHLDLSKNPGVLSGEDASVRKHKPAQSITALGSLWMLWFSLNAASFPSPSLVELVSPFVSAQLSCPPGSVMHRLLRGLSKCQYSHLIHNVFKSTMY